MHLHIMQHTVHNTAIKHGFDVNNREDGTSIALMHSELSEALEAMREGNPKDKHCPTYDSVDIELADCVIRIMDYCEGKGINLEAAIIAKMEFNHTREHKHGKDF
jgi:NTP pyrophosphatase (non-canonical NTP hydrolase)